MVCRWSTVLIGGVMIGGVRLGNGGGFGFEVLWFLGRGV